MPAYNKPCHVLLYWATDLLWDSLSTIVMLVFQICKIFIISNTAKIHSYRPGARSRMFFATFFSLLFPVIPYIGPSQVDNLHPQLRAILPQGPKIPLLGKSIQWYDVIAYIRVLQLHKWSDKSESLLGVSWHIGETIRIILWGILPFYFKYHPQFIPKDKKMCVRLPNCHQRWSFSSILLYISLPYVDVKNFPHL